MWSVAAENGKSTDGNCHPDCDVVPSCSSLSILALTCTGWALCLMLLQQFYLCLYPFPVLFAAASVVLGMLSEQYLLLHFYYFCSCLHCLSVLPVTKLHLKMDINPFNKPYFCDRKMWLSNMRGQESGDHQTDNKDLQAHHRPVVWVFIVSIHNEPNTHIPLFSVTMFVFSYIFTMQSKFIMVYGWQTLPLI